MAKADSSKIAKSLLYMARGIHWLDIWHKQQFSLQYHGSYKLRELGLLKLVSDQRCDRKLGSDPLRQR